MKSNDFPLFECFVVPSVFKPDPPAKSPPFLIKIGSSLFSVGEVNQEVKIWNSRTQEIEAGKDV